MKALDLNELKRIYDEAETVDREVFAEARSNVLLLAGDHFTKRDKGKNWREPSKEQDSVKLRIVKNHIHKIVRHYVSSILSYAPGVQLVPFCETDMQDQKEAELNQAVWEAGKAEHRMDEKIRKWAFEFTGTGEVASKIFFDPNQGDLQGYEQKVDEETGEPMFDPGPPDPFTGLPTQGNPVPDESRPVFKGKFVFESVFLGNLLRHVSTKDMRDSECLIIRKMVKVNDLKAKYRDDPEKLKGIVESSNEEFVVFDANRSGYERTKGECLVREYYWPSCTDYPEGYFAIATDTVVLEEGPLPAGVFPIAWAGFDEFPTSPRGRSIIKVARPYVAEICRASSAMAMHQVTIGDDKIIYQAGTKLAPGALLPGVRGLTYQGREPQILQGRDGGQYLNYIQAQIAELYSVVMMDEIHEEKGANIDPYALLYRSAKQETKFSLYGEKFQQFLMDVAMIYLELAKYYLPDDALIPAIGRREMINIQEFRSTSKLRYQIKPMPREDTLETMLGKQLQLQNVLQYAGKQLTKDDIGKLMKDAPFGNNKDAFEDFTLDSEIAENDLLALDRGQNPPPSQFDDPNYMAKKLSNRMRRPDFQFMSPQIQNNYQQRLGFYEQLIARKQQELLAAQAQYIPTDGALVPCDLYVQDPSKPQDQPRRIRLPERSLEWLSKQLQAQGANLSAMQQQNPGVISDVAQKLLAAANQTQFGNQGNQAASAGQLQPPTAMGMPGT